MQLTHLPSVSGTHFMNDFSLTIQIRWIFSFAATQSLVIRSQQILHKSQQHSCHAMCKVCSDHFVRTLLWTKIHFHPIWLVMEISLVEWVPGPIDVRSSAMFRISSRLSYVIHGLVITWSKLTQHSFFTITSMQLWTTINSFHICIETL